MCPPRRRTYAKAERLSQGGVHMLKLHVNASTTHVRNSGVHMCTAVRRAYANAAPVRHGGARPARRHACASAVRVRIGSLVQPGSMLPPRILYQ